MSFLFFFDQVLVMGCGIFSCGMPALSFNILNLVPQLGIKPRPLHWECRVSATVPPRKPFSVSFNKHLLRIHITSVGLKTNFYYPFRFCPWGLWIKLTNTSLLGEKIYFVCRFQIGNIVLLTIIVLLYITSYHWKFVPLTTFICFFHSLPLPLVTTNLFSVSVNLVFLRFSI